MDCLSNASELAGKFDCNLNAIYPISVTANFHLFSSADKKTKGFDLKSAYSVLLFKLTSESDRTTSNYHFGLWSHQSGHKLYFHYYLFTIRSDLLARSITISIPAGN